MAVRELLGGKLRDSDSAEGQGLAKIESLNSRLTITANGSLSVDCGLADDSPATAGFTDFQWRTFHLDEESAYLTANRTLQFHYSE